MNSNSRLCSCLMSCNSPRIELSRSLSLSKWALSFSFEFSILFLFYYVKGYVSYKSHLTAPSLTNAWIWKALTENFIWSWWGIDTASSTESHVRVLCRGQIEMEFSKNGNSFLHHMFLLRTWMGTLQHQKSIVQNQYSTKHGGISEPILLILFIAFDLSFSFSGKLTQLYNAVVSFTTSLLLS